MGKKRFNWKARQVVKADIDTSEEKKIKVVLPQSNSYDECNALVLPSKKRKTRIKNEQQQCQRFLSKKQRKALEKIVEKKKKKENRASLLESLSAVQVPDEELKLLASISSIQTRGLKRHRAGVENDYAPVIKTVDNDGNKINPVKGARKKLRLLGLLSYLDGNSKKRKKDPNIVDLETSEDEAEENEEPGSGEEEAEFEGILSEKDRKAEEITKQENNKEVYTKAVSAKKEKAPESKIDEVSSSNSDPENKTEILKKQLLRKPAVFVSVNRLPEVQETRMKLPILAEEQIVMEAISENPIVLIAGETGSGKTTQVPQFLYEAGYTQDGKMIGVTEPRRVAAISMAQRVAEELGLGSDVVSYLIRFEGNVTHKTEIKFMTDGVLLKEIQNDFLLTKYSVIILDEAHERSVYTDILMGLLSRIVPLRNKKGNPLKLIIMSATLRLEDFTQNKHLFKIPPPVIKVDSRQFPVTIHFNKRTNPDYLREAYKKTCRIHTELPEGGILIFLTGQQEVKTLARKLREAFPMKNRAFYKKSKEEQENDEELTLQKAINGAKKKKKLELTLPQINLDSFPSAPSDDTEGDLLGELEDSDEEEWDMDGLAKPGSALSQPLWVLPLYSLLPTSKQSQVFKPPPEGTRLCVVATNVAETSLTIPGIKYVVDCGKVKTKLYDKITGVTAFGVVWASKAAANQRAGRAGRTSPGHCYRLYSSAIFNDEFQDWSDPEMTKRNVDDLVLQMKSLGIQKILNFPFPTPPDLDQLQAAERRLVLIGALESSPFGSKECSGKLTKLGTSMAAFPVAPRFAKMLCLSHQYNLLEYTIAIIAALSVRELLSCALDKKVANKWSGTGHSLLLGDVMLYLRAIGGAEFANFSGKLGEFCKEHNLRENAVIEARKLRQQLTSEINLNCPHLSLCVNPRLPPPSDVQARLLRQIMLAGLVDHVARKNELIENGKKKKAEYFNSEMDQRIFIHSDSCLYRHNPEWIVYQEIFQTNKMYMKVVSAIEPEWLATFAPTICNFKDPEKEPPPRYDEAKGIVLCHVTGTFGKRGWQLPLVEIEYPTSLDKYRWLSIFILDGTMFPKLKKFSGTLLSSPKTMMKSWARLQPRTEFFLKTLVAKEADNRDKLLSIWRDDSKFLLTAYLKWLPSSAEKEVYTIWPPI